MSSLSYKGITYSLDEWVTLTKYCELYKLNSSTVVSNWIRRGIVPKEDIINVPEFNNLKLIKKKEYKTI